MADKPAFDPSQPFQVADKPPFDPSKPFDAAPTIGLGEDVLKSGASGLASAAAGTFGAMGDLRSLASTATSAIGDKLGVSPDKVQAFKDTLGKAADLTPPTALMARAPSTRDIINNSDPIVSPDYKPQTTLGGYVKTGAEFAPGMLAGGPEGAGARFLTNVALPAIGSETAGKLTEGTAFEPYARVAGALVAPGAESAAVQKFKDMIAARKAAALLPEAADIKTASRDLYQHPDVAAVQIKPDAVSDLADTISADLQSGPNSGFRRANEPKVFNAVDELRTPARSEVSPSASLSFERDVPFAGGTSGRQFAIHDPNGTRMGRVVIEPKDGGKTLEIVDIGTEGGSSNKLNLGPSVMRDVLDGLREQYPDAETLTGYRIGGAHKGATRDVTFQLPAKKAAPSAKIADLDNVRQILGGLAKEKDAIGQPTRQAAAASRAIGHIDDFLPNLKQSDLLAGDAAKANGILGEARANWAAYKKSSQVQNLASNAELNAASSHSGANIQNATKQAFKPLLKNNGAKVASWSPEEKDALNSIVRGTWTGHIARAAGNVLGGGGGLGMLLGAGAGYEGGGIPGALAGAAAGRAFKMIGNRSTLNAVQNLDTLIRSRSPAALKIAAQNPQAVQALPAQSVKMLRAMIVFDPTLRALNQPGAAVGQSDAQQSN